MSTNPDPAPGSEVHKGICRPPPHILPSLLRSYVPSSRPLTSACPSPPWAEDVIPATELLARAEANRYKKREHKEKDVVRNRHKHVDKTKKNQDAELDRYVL
jgi:hypothetical protein